MIQFLTKLLRLFGASDTGSESEGVGQSEWLARFLFSSGHYAETKGVVKSKAFMPDSHGETSMFRISGLREKETWQLADTFSRVGPPAQARADIIALTATRLGLRVEPATEGGQHKRHAVIVGWPVEKHQKQALATQIASCAALHMRT